MTAENLSNVEIPFGRPWIEQEEKDAVLDVLNGHILTHGKSCEDFENSIESNVHEILNEDTNSKNQDDLSSSCKKEIIECDTSEFDDNILNEMTQNENLENSEDSNYHKIENEYLENSEESNIHENMKLR